MNFTHSSNLLLLQKIPMYLSCNLVNISNLSVFDELFSLFKCLTLPALKTYLDNISCEVFPAHWHFWSDDQNPHHKFR